MGYASAAAAGFGNWGSVVATVCRVWVAAVFLRGAGAVFVCGADGLDEITTTARTNVASLENGAVETFEIVPEDVGLERVQFEELIGGDATENADALAAVLNGEKGAYRDIALFNAAAALMVAGRADDLRTGIVLAQRSIDSGEAKRRLQRLIAVSKSLSRGHGLKA